MGKHRVARGEARLWTAVCECGETVHARTYESSTLWYVPMFCAECTRHRIRMSVWTVLEKNRTKAPKPNDASCKVCNAPFRSKSMGVKKGRTQCCSERCSRQAGRRYPNERAQRTANRHMRRARIKGQPAERGLSYERIAQRDGWRCHVCRKAIHPTSTDWHTRPSLDHLIPISQGGSHTLSNAALAHLGCNVGRGKVSVAQQVLL